VKAASGDTRPYLHPNMAETYRRRIADLAQVLESDGVEARGAQQEIRSLIERIVYHAGTNACDNRANR
jgi:hypothetical protein